VARVSVLGLGAMGSRLATVLLERGHEVTVWNRSASARESAVVEGGAARAGTPAAAVAAAPLVLMCVTDYPAADEVLAAPGVLGALPGRAFASSPTAPSKRSGRSSSASPVPACACSPAPSPRTRGTSAARRR
jgi:3-hydroxyisobutyrate dehydrogenase-like beta-hydroxyacid dehydrogenase